MKYFVISDIHGHYQVMIDALQKSGFDMTNDSHHLLVLGDMFDRGKESKEVLEYLYHLTTIHKATVILGNHDSFLLEFLEGAFSNAEFNIQYNGFGDTLYSLSGYNPYVIELALIKEVIEERYPYLKEWLSSLPLYLERGDYIFVHGGIDGGMLDWKSMSSKRDFIWNREITLPPVPGKTVVAGHHRVATIRKRAMDYHMLFLEEPEQFDILYAEGKILIDRFVETSGEINVLILDIEA